jgi:hypothetical protein
MLRRYHIIDLEDLRRAGKRASEYRGPLTTSAPYEEIDLSRLANRPVTKGRGRSVPHNQKLPAILDAGEAAAGAALPAIAGHSTSAPPT